jgi:hypothetical protein
VDLVNGLNEEWAMAARRMSQIWTRRSKGIDRNKASAMAVIRGDAGLASRPLP